MKVKQALISSAGVFVFAVTVAPQAGAQQYPEKAIRVIVPWPAAGVVDLAGRIVGERMTAALGQPVIIDNRPGAGGMIGAEMVVKAPADGYTLLLTSTGLNMSTALGQKLTVDVDKAFVPVRVVAWAPSILVTSTGLKVKTVKELVEQARSRPGQLTYASAGNGSPAHFAAEMFRNDAGINLIHVPFKGAVAAMNDQLAGRVDFHFANTTVALPQIKAGKVTALAITTPKRSPMAPDVPTMAEAGYPEVRASQWVGYFVPAGTSRAIVERLAATIGKAVATPEVQAVMSQQGMEVDTDSTPESFAAMMKTDLQRWQAVAKAAGIKPD
jgi:tripartite-type tricarboxylate transporter receptor subunit TctC